MAVPKKKRSKSVVRNRRFNNLIKIMKNIIANNINYCNICNTPKKNNYKCLHCVYFFRKILNLKKN